MKDISNKLHAMVDEFVSNLTSECDTLAKDICSHGQKYAAPATAPEEGKTTRLSNRTTTEVLNGLRRPSSDHGAEYQVKEVKSHLQHGLSTLQEAVTKTRQGGKFVRQVLEKLPLPSPVNKDDIFNDVTSVDNDSDNSLSKEESEHGRGTFGKAAINKSMHTIEILSSDQSSDDIRINKKHSKKPLVKQSSTKVTKSSSRGRTFRMELKSPSRSPESSHVMNYSYDTDTLSPGGRSPTLEATFPKLKWPKDVDTAHDRETGKKAESNSALGNSETLSKFERKKILQSKRLKEGEESSEEDLEGNDNGGETDSEELPVLPKVPVKRKLMSEPRSAEKSTKRGRPKSGPPATKKQRTPQMDASVITQLEFGKRPQNCVSKPSPSLCVLPIWGPGICNTD